MKLATLSLLLGLVATGGAEPLTQRHPEELPYFQEGYPKAFWFRSDAAFWRKIYTDTDRFDKGFQHLDAFMLKVLNEEGVRDMGQPILKEYAQRHPDSLLVLHYLGDGVDPRGGPTTFTPGHYLHSVGTTVLDPVASSDTRATYRVKNTARLAGYKKSFRDTTEFIGGVTLCPLKNDGTPDWDRGEYAGLLAVDEPAGTVTLQRAIHGPNKVDLPAGQTYIAHRGMAFMSPKNYSTRAPRDASGRTCAQAEVDYYADIFGPGGLLEHFDGIQFDVMPFVAGLPDAELGEEASQDGLAFDMDGNGQPDDFDQQLDFIRGVRDFASLLRERLPGFLINGDDNTRQCTHSLFNGSESEGWPNVVWDWDQIFWSQGVNLRLFWRDRSSPPAFNYLVQKRRGNYGPGKAFFEGHEEGLDRVLYAMSTMFDGGIGLFGDFNDEGKQGRKNISPVQIPPDEIVMGGEMKLRWLGQPVEPPRRLGLETDDFLKGAGKNPDDAFLSQFRSGKHSPHPVTIQSRDGGIVFSSPETKGIQPCFARWQGFDWPGGDLLVSLTARADPPTGLDPAIPRMFWLRLARPGDEIDPSKRRGNFRRPVFEDKANLSPQYLSCYADTTPFPGVFYFRDVKAGRVEFDIEISGGEPLYLSNLTVHNAADTFVRGFEHGAVLVNPSRKDYTFHLQQLFPGQSFRRLQGVQTPEFNNGSPAGPTLTLPERDAIFLIKNQ